jgi:hypothetical protein
MSKELNIKLKTNKKPTQDFKTTLDAIHHKQLDKFNTQYTKKDILKQELQVLEAKLKIVPPEDKYECQRKIDELNTQIRKIDNKDDLMDYYLQTGNILYDYYDIQDKISSGLQIQQSRHKSRPGSIFAALEEAAAQDKEVTEPVSSSGKVYAQPTVYSREKILDTYLHIVDPEIARQGNSSTENGWTECTFCGTDMIFNVNEAYITCPSCGAQENVLIDSDKPSYKDPPREVSYYAYKRINHFNEWLAQFQAKESTDIPQEIFDQILVELKKERITNMAAVKQSKLKEILKKIKFNKYEHVPHILSRLNGQNAPVMSRENEEKFRYMFREIQPSFQRHCPPDRKNFLSYSYVLYKFCELLELDEFLPCFPLLKNRDKLYQQDKIWEKICEDMKWQFIRTI